jgi:Flp pilus assembly pilin Flp
MDENGASAVEYCLLLALIAMVVLIGVTNLGQTLSNMFVGFANTILTSTGS